MFLQDLRYALRQLRRAPGFAFTIAILSAAMPLASIVAIFTGTGTASASPAISVGPFLSAIHTVFTLSAVLLVVAVIPSALRGKENRRGE